MLGVSKEVVFGVYLVVGILLFVIGCFIGIFLMFYIKDSILLGVYGLIVVGFCLMGIMLGGVVVVYVIFVVNFFMFIMFFMIFGLGVWDLGKYIKLGLFFIIMVIMGGVVFFLIMGIFFEFVNI